MVNKMKELLNILEDDIEVYEEMLVISAKEKEAMLSYKLQDILDCQRERKVKNFKALELEEKRYAVLNAVSEDLGLPANKITVSKILEHVDTEIAGSIKECSDRLRKITSTLMKRESENRIIAERALSLIGQSVKILSGVNSKDPVYLANGAVTKQDDSYRRLSREV